MAPSRHRLIVVSGAHALSGLDVPDFVEVRAGLTSRECQDLSERARLNVVPLRDVATAAGVVSLLEAMILGKAVIATRTTGTLDYIEDGRTGIMTPPDDEVALRAAIERVWSDSALRESLGQSARSRAVSDFTFAAAARRMRTLLDGLESGARSGLSLS
jgi:glycosyltransferase involved in cell wall biosynthesis